jgi:hypothetical protein
MKSVPLAPLHILATALVFATSLLSAQPEATTVAANNPAGEVLVPNQEVNLLIEIHRLPTFYLALSPSLVPPPDLSEDAYFDSQALIMDSASVLKRVIDRLDLTARFNNISIDDLLARLGRQVSTTRLDNSTLFNVRVRAKTVEEGRELAEAVAQSYRELLLHDHREHAGRQLSALQAEVRSQEDLVEEKRKLYHTICKATGIIAVEGRSIHDAIERRMAERRAEEGQDGEIDQALQSQDIIQAADDFQAAADLLREMAQQHSKGRIALNLSLEPVTIRGFQ